MTRPDAITAAPDRSLVQRMEALQRANVIRTQRASLKRDLEAGRTSLARVLIAPPEYAEAAKVAVLLLSVPKVGRVKANKALTVCRIAPGKTVGGLSERQRAELVGWLGWLPTGGTAPRTPRLGSDPDMQHMRALAQATATRLALSALKRQVASGEVTAVSVLRDVPEHVGSMPIWELIGAQHRWGKQRTRRFLLRENVSHGRTLRGLTQRQRLALADALEFGAPAPPPPTPVGAIVVLSRPGRLHLIADNAYLPACNTEGKCVRANAADWLAPDALRCRICVASTRTRGLVPHD